MFNASPFEFRFRYALHAVIYALAFWAPWNISLHIDPPGPNAHVWGILAANMSQVGWMRIDAAFNLLLSIAILFALAGAAIRTWGGAYLGADIVQDSAMHSTVSPTPFAGPALTGVLTDGPFRRSRNPLYLGTFLHTIALALLMPRSGAIFAIVMIGVLQIRLILAEEKFLRATVGVPYQAYCKLVPRILPALIPRVAPSGRQPRWPQAFAGESYMWIVALAFAFAGWRYQATLLIQCVLVAFGISIVIKALTPQPQPQPAPQPTTPTI